MGAGEIDIFKLPVFPPADVFPMMADDELAGLAEDIKANGLREPLVIGQVGAEVMLIDGRNRRAACKMAGVEPATRELNGEDPTSYVLSANIHRRHMTKSQRYMAIAMVMPAQKGGRGKTVRVPEEFSKQVISNARVVLRASPDLAQSVLLGDTALDAAYRQVRHDEGAIRNKRPRTSRRAL